MAEFHELGTRRAAPGVRRARRRRVRLDGPRTRRVHGRRTRSRRAADDARAVRVAVIGRPNVGKSTLINALLGEERVIAFDAPGTTRDAIDVPFELRRPAVRAGRHRRHPPQGQGLRDGGEVLGRQDTAGDRPGQRRAAGARRVGRSRRAGRAHRRLHPRGRTRAGDRRQQVGRPRRLHAHDGQAVARTQAALPRLGAHAFRLGPQGHRSRAADALGDRGASRRRSRACRRPSSPAR